MAYLRSVQGGNVVPANATFPAGHVLQTLSTHDKTEFSFTMSDVGNTYTTNGYGQGGTDYTGIDTTMTMTSITNKLFVFGKVSIGPGRGDLYGVMRMRKGIDGSFATMSEVTCPWHKESSGTPGAGTLVGISSCTIVDSVGTQETWEIPFGFLDTPASLSAITYRMNFLIERDQSPVYNAKVNSNAYGGTDYGQAQGTSYMTIMEIQV